MANPNIAAIGELYGATLGFRVSSAQPVFASSGGLTINNNSTTSTTSITTPTQYSNRILICQVSSWDSSYANNSGNTMTYNGVSMTRINNTSGDHAGAIHFYLVNPATGANDLVFNLNGSTSSNTTWGQYAYFYNINQTDPFRTLTGGVKYFTDSYYYSSSSMDWDNDNSTATLRFASMPGDIGLLLLVGGRRSASTTNFTASSASESWTGSSMWASGSSGNYWGHRAVGSYVKIDSTSVNMQANGSSWYNNSNSDTSTTGTAMVMQPSAGSTVMTCPSGYVIKVNSVRAGNPEAAGLTATLSVSGLVASGDSPSTYRNAADNADVVTASGNVQGVNLSTAVTIPQTGSLELLSRPFWLTEGDNLETLVMFAQPTMQNSVIEAYAADFVVTFDIIKQSS